MLTDEQYAFLKQESHRTGLSAGELVRRALDASYQLDQRRRVRGFDVSLGVWRSPDAAVAGRRAGGRGLRLQRRA